MTDNKYTWRRQAFDPTNSFITDAVTPVRKAPTDWTYGAIDWLNDATTAFYQSVQQGEMDASLDRIIAAQENKSDAEAYAAYLSEVGNMSEEEFELFKQTDDYKFYSESLNKLRKNGAWRSQNDPTLDDLQQIIDQSDKDIADANEDYQIDRQQYTQSRHNRDISQYYTAKSNEEVMGWGNFLYKMPATMGTSNTSPVWQMSSMAASYAGVKGGAAIGSIAGPIGTFVGGAVGFIGGAVLGTVAGGMQSRQEESHMEAFGAIKQKFYEQCLQKGVDPSDYVKKQREYLAKQGVDHGVLSDDQVLAEAMINDEMLGSDSLFKEMVSDSFKSSRRLFERNMALEAGEQLTQLAYFVPVGKWLGKGVGTIGKGITGALAKRSAEGTKVALKSLDDFGNALYKSQIWKTVKDKTTALALDMLQESSEEGAQHIMSNRFINGEYDDDVANTTAWDAFTSGQLLEDVGSNFWDRGRSFVAVMGLDPEYADDQQLYESMLSGALLPITSPQALVSGASNYFETVNKIRNSKKFGNWFAEHLAQQDETDRNVDLLKMLREGNRTVGDYTDTLESIREALKSGKYDTTTMSQDGKTQLTEQEIDDFIDKQQGYFRHLNNTKQTYQKRAEKLELAPEDTDIYYALADKYERLAGLMSDSQDKAANKHINDISALASEKVVSFNFQDATEDQLRSSAERSLLIEQRQQLQELLVEESLRAALLKITKEYGITSKAAVDKNARNLSAISSEIDKIDKRLSEKRLGNAVSENLLDILSPDKQATYKQSVNEQTMLHVANAANDAILNTFKDQTKKDEIQDYIEEYKARIRRQHAQADAANAVARGETTEILGNRQLGQEQLNEAQTAAKQQLDVNIDALTQVIEDVAEDSPIYNLVNELKQGRTLFQDNMKYANFVRNVLKKNLKKYEALLAKDGISDEVKNLYKQIVDTIKALDENYTTIEDTIAEANARKQRKNPRFTTNSNVYFDRSTGDRYQIIANEAQYSEDEGLLLPIVKLGDSTKAAALKSEVKILTAQLDKVKEDAADSDKKLQKYQKTVEKAEDRIKQLIQELEDLREAAKHATDETEAEIDEQISETESKLDEAKANRGMAKLSIDNEKLKDYQTQIGALETAISNLNDQITDSTNQEQLMRVSDNEDFLKSLVYVDRKGNDISFEHRLKKYTDDVEEKIKKAAEYRKTHKQQAAEDGDVLEDTRSDKRMLAWMVDKEETDATDTDFKLIGMPLQYTSEGKAVATRLTNPLYRADYWEGYTAVWYNNEQELRDGFGGPLSGEMRSFKSESELKWDRVAAVNLYHKLGKHLESLKTLAEKQEILNKLMEGETVKIGNYEITSAKFDNMVYCLPLFSSLSQQDSHLYNQLIVHPDVQSKTEKFTRREYNTRANVIYGLLERYKTPKKEEVAEDAENSQEGFVDPNNQQVEGERHLLYSRVYFNKRDSEKGTDGDVNVVFREFNNASKIQHDEEDLVFLNDQGEPYTKEQLNTIYRDRAVEASGEVAGDKAAMDKVLDRIKELGFVRSRKEMNEAIPHPKERKDSGVTITRLALLIEGALRYGDGYMSRQVFLNDYIKNALGQSTTVSNDKNVINARALELLKVIQDVTPNSFLSHKDLQSERENTPDVAISMRNAKKPQITTLVNDREVNVNTEDSQELADAIALFEDLEAQLTNPNMTGDRFMQYLEDNGIKFVKRSGKKDFDASEIIRRYFDNRRFARLSVPSNIFQAVLFGSESPMQDNKIDYSHFRQTLVPSFGKVTDVDSLCIVENEDGQLIHSRIKYQQRHEHGEEVARLKMELEEAALTDDTKFDETIDGIFSTINRSRIYKKEEKTTQLLKELESQLSLSKEEIIKQIGESAYGDRIKSTLIQKLTDETSLSITQRDQLNHILKAAKHDANRKKLDADIEGIENILRVTSDSYATQPVTIAYGSESSVAGTGSVVYVDASGTHVVKNTTGTSGSIYLILPSMLNPRGDKVAIKLNPSRFDEPLATFIATVLEQVDRGAVQLNSEISELNLPSEMSVTGNVTVQELLDELVFTGTDAIESNPSANNYNRLLYVDRDGHVRYGSSSDGLGNRMSSVQELALWIQDNKTYRVDKEKLNPAEFCGTDVHIYVNGNEIFGHAANENYTKFLLTSGILQTNLDPSKNAHVFGNPSVYIKHKKYYAKGAAAVRNVESKKSSTENTPANTEIKSQSKLDAAIAKRAAELAAAGKVNVLEQLTAVISTYESSLASEESPEYVATLDGQTYAVSYMDDTVVSALNASNGMKPNLDTVVNNMIKSGKDAVIDVSTTDGTAVKKITIKAKKSKKSENTSVPEGTSQESLAATIGAAIAVAMQQLGVTAQPNAQQQTSGEQPAAGSTKIAITENGNNWVLRIDGVSDVFEFPKSTVPDRAVVQTVFPDYVDEVLAAIQAKVNSPSQPAQGASATATPAASATPPAPKKTAVLGDVVENYEQFKLIGDWLRNNTSSPDDLKLWEQFTNAKEVTETQVGAILMQYYRKLGKDIKHATSNVTSDLKRKIASDANNERASLLGSIHQFNSQFVEKEDVNEAIARVERTLGKGFNLQLDSNIRRVWDTVRRAQIYVFGQCSAAGIRLYRSAEGKVAKGVGDHEAFHAISLFVLSAEERKEMYKQAINAYPELQGMTVLQINEFLADKYIEFVQNSQKLNKNAYYKRRGVGRFFEKLWDTVRRLLNRLIKANITPKYVNLDKLFKDMYSGRYAYAEATKDNIEEYNKLFFGRPLYSGFSINGVEVAENGQQLESMFRDIVDTILQNSNMLDMRRGDFSYDLQTVKYHYERMLVSLSKNLEQAWEKGDYELAENLNNAFNTYSKIVTNWDILSNYCIERMNRKFNIGKKISNDADDAYQIAYTVGEAEQGNTEDVENDPTSDIDIENLNFAETIERGDNIDRFKATDIKVISILWSVLDSDKLDMYGMPQYANPKQLYTDLSVLCTGAQTYDEMYKRISDKAKQIDEEGGSVNYYAQLAALLDRASNDIKNAFFTNIVNYRNNFIAHYFTSVEDKDSESSVAKHDAEVRNLNLDRVQSELRRQWSGQLEQQLQNLYQEAQEQKDSSTYQNSIVSPFNKAADSKNVETLAKLFETTLGLKLDVNELKKYFDKRPEAWATIKKTVSSPLGKLISASKKADTQYDKALRATINGKVGNRDGMLTPGSFLFDFSEFSSQVAEAVAKNDSISAGARGTRRHAIVHYNYFTRFFDIICKTKEWWEQASKDPYNQHSVWLPQLKQFHKKGAVIAEELKLMTVSTTVIDNDVQGSRDYMAISRKEDLISKFVDVMEGYHVPQTFANKKTYYNIKGIKNYQHYSKAPVALKFSPKRGSMSINDAYVDIFVGYFADELYAIAEAYKTRDQFIDKFNRITGKSFTAETFSALSASEQEDYFRKYKGLDNLLATLRRVYHYKDGEAEFIRKGDTYVCRAFHLDLTKGEGYQSRHFRKMMDKLGIQWTPQLIAKLTSELQREGAANDIIGRGNVRDKIKNQLLANVEAVFDNFENEGIIDSEFNSISLPTNVIESNDLCQAFLSDGKVTPNAIRVALAQYTIDSMITTIELEKLCIGDRAFFKNNTDQNKRYSALTSTYQLNNNKGSIKNAYVEDTLYESDSYRSITINTTKVSDRYTYNVLAERALGVPHNQVVVDVEIIKDKDGKSKGIGGVLNHNALLSNGKLKESVKEAPIVKELLELQAKGKITLGSDLEIAMKACAAFKRSYDTYLNIDPTDAQTWISASMDRQLRQRIGDWNEYCEACYDILENYDNIAEIARKHPKSFAHTCTMLQVKPDELLAKFKEVDWNDSTPEALQKREQYKGYILSITRGFDTTSKKYIYYDSMSGQSSDKHFAPIYDKTSASPIYKIFADGHFMRDVYDFMQEQDIQLMKMETAVKSAGMPSFEMVDENGKFNKESLLHSAVLQQKFSGFNKQLNTDPHHSSQSKLLTQFMKVAVTNIKPDSKYTINGTELTGAQLLEMYKNILDELTVRGHKKFMSDYGVTEQGLDRVKFMNKLREMAETQDLPQETIEALTTQNGDFAIHPAALPNINWIQSRLVSNMDETVIKTITPGKPLYQVASLGYDNFQNIQTHPDKYLRAYDENGRMEVKLSISFFDDVLKAAGLQDASFDEQAAFIMENQELLGLSYRVPTQAQSSTIAVSIVELLPPQRGAIIMFPSGITARTGSDFDIDKMFLARPNFEVVEVNGKKVLKKIQYNMDEILSGDLSNIKDKQLQNALLDMFDTVLTSENHFADTQTPLDVAIDPLKSLSKKVRSARGMSEDVDLADLWDLTPVYQTDQKVKNQGSDNGIGPMALNLAFQFFIQASGLELSPNDELVKLGLSELNKIYNRDGGKISDNCSGQVTAHVDAVKDNYIGAMNVNQYTYDVTSFLTALGFGDGVYGLLGQPIVIRLAQKWMEYKTSKLGIDEEAAVGENFIRETMSEFAVAQDSEHFNRSLGMATPEQMQQSVLETNFIYQDSDAYRATQLQYLNTFLYVKNLASGYRDALTAAQVDTYKYGITANQIISFVQAHDHYLSAYNYIFDNANVLFDDTFLGQKYELGVKGLFNAFGGAVLEFTPGYKNTIDMMCKQYGVYGSFSKNFVRRVGPKLKTAIFQHFFNDWLSKRFTDTDKPLFKLTVGEGSVVGRFAEIKRKALREGEGQGLFDVLQPNEIQLRAGVPAFFNVSPALKEDSIKRDNAQIGWRELLDSNDADVRQWAEDLIVYMFYVSGGSDSNVGGRIKTSIFDLTPPTALANLSNGEMTYNEYVNSIMDFMQKKDSTLSTAVQNQAMQLVALFDDDIIPTVTPGKKTSVSYLVDNKDVLTIKKGSSQLLDYSTGSYKPYIKLKLNDSITVYKLGNITISTGKGGKHYVNPVYFKVNPIGYRSRYNVAYSLRADGNVTNGTVNSIFHQTRTYTPLNFAQLSMAESLAAVEKRKREEQQKTTGKRYAANASERRYEALAKLRKESNLIWLNASEQIDFSSWADQFGVLPKGLEYDGWGIPYCSYAAIDYADYVYFLYNGDVNRNTSNLIRYAEVKGKPFSVISQGRLEELPDEGSRVLLIGSGSYGDVMNVVSRLPENISFVSAADATVFDSVMENMVRYINSTGRGFSVTTGTQSTVDGKATVVVNQQTVNGKTIVISSEDYQETAPTRNPNVDFVFTENVQAAVAAGKHDVKLKVPTPKQGVTLKVRGGGNQAVVRTDHTGAVNKNAYGIIVKLYQQDKDGKFVEQEGCFKDTAEHKKLFETLNTEVFDALRSSENTQIVLPSQLALGKAALPMDFAKWLQQQLRERFNVKSTLMRNRTAGYSGYGLRVDGFEKKADDTITKELKESAQKQKENCK